LYDYGEESGNYVVRHYAAWKDEEWTEPLWWNPEELVKRENEIGFMAFMIEFMNARYVGYNAEFAREKFKYYVSDEVDQESWVYFFGVDVQSSTSKRADYFTISVVGLSPDGNLYVVEEERSKPSLPEKQEAIIRKYANYDPVKLVVIGTQTSEKHFFDSLVMRLQRERLPIPIVPFSSSENKIARISSTLSGPFHSGILYFNKSVTRTVQELVHLGTGISDDCADALEMAVRAAMVMKARRSASKQSSRASILAGKSSRKRVVEHRTLETKRR